MALPQENPLVQEPEPMSTGQEAPQQHDFLDDKYYSYQVFDLVCCKFVTDLEWNS
jgi:hypothetical protein